MQVFRLWLRVLLVYAGSGLVKALKMFFGFFGWAVLYICLSYIFVVLLFDISLPPLTVL